MQQEVKLCPISVKPEMESRLSIERREWQAFKEKSRRDLRSAGPASYWSSNRAPGSSNSARLEGQLTEGVNILEKTNLSLMRATQVAQESEQIGSEVIGELGIQRENLLRTRERLTDADQDLKRTHVMIKSINRRLLTNKCLLIVIILMELGILMALIYIKFIHKKSWKFLCKSCFKLEQEGTLTMRIFDY